MHFGFLLSLNIEIMARELACHGIVEIASGDGGVDLVTPPCNPVGDVAAAASAPGVMAGGALAQAAGVAGGGSKRVRRRPMPKPKGPVKREFSLGTKLAAIADAQAAFQLRLDGKG